MRRIASFIISCCLLNTVQAQPWTLTQCADYAVSHNIGVKQSENQRQLQEVQLNTSRAQRLPDLNGSAGENLSFGRAQTLDGTYSNRNTNNTSFSLSTSIPLFTGFQIPNQIKQNQLNLAAVTQDLEKARNDIRMQVAQAYVQILYDMEIADVAHRQIAIDSAQVARLQAFVANGKASQAELSQQMATLAQSHLTATQADNARQLSLLTLSQLLELPTPEGFAIVRPDTIQLLRHPLPATPDAVYAEALTQKPEVQAEQYRLSAAERGISVAKAALYPKLNFNAGLQSNYYKTNGMQADPFFTQLKNNFAQYMGMSLSIPIFTRFQARNNVRTARLNHERQQLALERVKKTLYKEIQQVFYNAQAAQSKYESCQAATISAQDAFALMQAKYENGKATITEFNESKNNYLKTESNLAQARYEYIYQTALLDFYRGKPLSF